MQGKWQGKCVGWIISRALQTHCNPRVSLGPKKLVSKEWMKRNYRGLQKIYVIWYSSCVLGESFARPFEISNFFSLDQGLLKTKIICFWFETMKIDWIWGKGFERFVTILTVSIDVIGVLSFQLVSILGKLVCKFKFVHWRIKNTLTALEYSICTYLFLITLCNMRRGL